MGEARGEAGGDGGATPLGSVLGALRGEPLLAAHLATLGLPAGLQLSAAATIGRDTLLAPPGTLPPPSKTVALPRIAVGDPALRGVNGDEPTEDADLQIAGLLGEGGMGKVYLARQRSLEREVAVKTLKEDVDDPRAADRLRVEATTMGRLEHPNVVPVHAVGRDPLGRLVLVMKRVDGVAWAELIHDSSHPRWSVLEPDPERRLEAHLRILEQVATALHFAHARGVVHRDVKPENVLLGEHGEVYLADWGVARVEGAAAPSELVGTPAYMAPEMVVGDPAFIDARTDVFLLGATLHELLTGRAPHARDSLQAALFAALEARPASYEDGVPEELAEIARRAMEADPSNRFPSALAFRMALDERRKRLGALTLLRSARALLAALEREEERADDGLRDRRLVECRFAFVLALREWPESPEGKVGFEAVVRLCVRHELARENAPAARALLSELTAPEPELLERVVRVEQELCKRREDVARLETLSRDQDLRVGLEARIGIWLGTCVGVLGVAVYVRGASLGGEQVEAGLAVRTAAFLAVLVSLGLFALRGHLLRNAAGRKSATFLAVAVLGVLVHRMVGTAHGASLSALLAMDLVLIAAVAASSSTLVPRAGWAALVALAAAPLTVVFPGRVLLIFSSAVGLTLVATALLWASAVRRTTAALDKP